ncbi:MAG: AMP-binding protein [Bacteroidota bacterium]
MYTSGSTGKPKGIPINHGNLAYSTGTRFRFYEEQPGSFLLLSSFSFDSSVAGIFWTLAAGGKLTLSARRAEQDPAALGRLIKAEGVTHTLMLPSLYQLLLEFANPEDLASLRVVMVAGEACPSSLVNRHFSLLPKTALVNEYGPTEGTVWSTAHHVQPEDAEEGAESRRHAPACGPPHPRQRPGHGVPWKAPPRPAHGVRVGASGGGSRHAAAEHVPLAVDLLAVVDARLDAVDHGALAPAMAPRVVPGEDVSGAGTPHRENQVETVRSYCASGASSVGYQTGWGSERRGGTPASRCPSSTASSAATYAA